MRSITIICIIVLSLAFTANAGDKLLHGTKHYDGSEIKDNKVSHRCLTSELPTMLKSPLQRANKWSLPDKALAGDYEDTLHILVLRYNFQLESPDDPNTTGLGQMNISTDLQAFIDSAGHEIDPPPHNADYFNAHMRAMKEYYEIVSDGKISLTWDIYPQVSDSAYLLPHQMSSYGKCDFDSVVFGLENFFVDCIQLADTAEPSIVFSDYDGYILFHAGSDQQNNLGFPETCADMFTGYIKFGDSVGVDNDTYYISEAVMMPETASQDNRATALNAVMAHEFGHLLGLPDLYSTSSFMSQLGDFALMDNNGFGTGIDFGFEVGRVFGAIPLFPMAWCRAYLGYVEVYDFRQGTDIRLAAAEIVSDGIQIARIPISENEYYLLENRVIDFDGHNTGAQADSLTNVILGPAYVDETDNNYIKRSREYDFLMPDSSSGVLIYHVDERVATLDYDYDGMNNFDDNDLQWAWDIFGNPVNRFITLVEGDGLVNFGGYYRSGYGKAIDMYRDGLNDALTPNTVPPSIDNTGNNTHINITNIRRGIDVSSGIPQIMDTVILFDVETDKLVENFPVRAGAPVYPISPVVDDIDGDGLDEIICVSDDLLTVFGSDGSNFLRDKTDCNTCPIYTDTTVASVHTGVPQALPLYEKLPETIFAGPVTGTFADNPTSEKLVVVGGDFGFTNVILYSMVDAGQNGRADILGGVNSAFFSTGGDPIAMNFDNQILYVLTNAGEIYKKRGFVSGPQKIDSIAVHDYHGIARVDSSLILLAGSAIESKLYYINNGIRDSIMLGDDYILGPILLDIDRDGTYEVAAATENGSVILVSVDNSATSDRFSVLAQKDFGYRFNVNPVAGDVDRDGYPDLVIAGRNAVYAFDQHLVLKTSFPLEIDDRYPTTDPASSPIIVDVEPGGNPEIVVASQNGNIYVLGSGYNPDFPLSGGELGIGSPLVIRDTLDNSMLGYLGLDGWFYLWHIDGDENNNFWPNGGADGANSNRFDSSKLPAIASYADKFDEKKFYNYPNPVTDGSTTIRYFLGENASSVKLNIFDLSGQEIEVLDGGTAGGFDNEVIWDCSNITPGVYRCVINVEFAGETKTAYTDIAVIR